MPEKLALCIGINGYPFGAELAGCVNDALDWTELLASRGYEIVDQLLDQEATGDEIRDWVLWLTQYLGRGDQLVITFSGHGTWMPDRNGDEPDLRDEAICPVDLENGPILDDWLWNTFGQAHPQSKTIFISDSCHSGTVTRMAGGRGGGTRVRFLPPAFYLGDKKAERVAKELPATVAPTRAAVKEIPMALTLSGCADAEYSYDAYFGNRPNGAFTRAAVDALAPGATYSQWHTAMRKKLPSMTYPQTPQITGLTAQKRWKALT